MQSLKQKSILDPHLTETESKIGKRKYLSTTCEQLKHIYIYIYINLHEKQHHHGMQTTIFLALGDIYTPPKKHKIIKIVKKTLENFVNILYIYIYTDYSTTVNSLQK